MLEGGCLCEHVRYRYVGVVTEISMCHCSQCRKAQGSAFAAVSPIAAELFHITRGAAYLKEFRATPAKARVFCRECGSPLYSVRDDLPHIMRLRVGTLDTPISVAHRYHAFVDDKAPWFEITDTLPQYPHRGGGNAS